MKDKLRALVRLAEIDAAARHVEDQLRGIPQELDERRAAVTGLEALVGNQGRQMSEAERLLEQQEQELRSRSEMLSRSKAKGAKARNMREAEAAERELDAVRRSIREAEEERDRLKVMIQSTNTMLEGPRGELDEQKTALGEAETASHTRLAALRDELGGAVAGREVFAAQVPKEFLRRYERIRHKIHPAVVECVDGVCRGCRMHVPPQLYNQITRANDFHQCQACQRFLYYRTALED